MRHFEVESIDQLDGQLSFQPCPTCWPKSDTIGYARPSSRCPQACYERFRVVAQFNQYVSTLH